jgi:hypothetical protein
MRSWVKSNANTNDFRQEINTSVASKAFGAAATPGSNQRRVFDAKMALTTDMLCSASVAKMGGVATTQDNGNIVWGSGFSPPPNSFQLTRRRKQNGTFFHDRQDL